MPHGESGVRDHQACLRQRITATLPPSVNVQRQHLAMRGAQSPCCIAIEFDFVASRGVSAQQRKCALRLLPTLISTKFTTRSSPDGLNTSLRSFALSQAYASVERSSWLLPVLAFIDSRHTTRLHVSRHLGRYDAAAQHAEWNLLLRGEPQGILGACLATPAAPPGTGNAGNDRGPH